MPTIISDVGGINFGNNSAAYQSYDLTASVAANAITVTLQPCVLTFRSTTLTTGTPTVATVSSPITLTIAATDSFGLVTAAGNQRIVLMAHNNAGTAELSASALYGGVNLDGTALITTVTAATTATQIKSTTARTSVAQQVVGFLDATFTTAVGWGSLVLVQGAGGNALTAMSSLGYGQTWQDVTGSRSSGTTYYNTTGKPIVVGLYGQSSAGSQTQTITVNGLQVANSAMSTGAAQTHGGAYAVVPLGASYSCILGFGSSNTWRELR